MNRTAIDVSIFVAVLCGVLLVSIPFLGNLLPPPESEDEPTTASVEEELAKNLEPAKSEPEPPQKSQLVTASPENRERWAKIEEELVAASGDSAEEVNLANQRFVLVYFSAHWCPPCRAFTPKLVKWYNRAKDGNNVEIVFVSLDRSRNDMLGYMKDADMPWPATAYKSSVAASLRDEFCGPGIPCMVLLDSNFNVLSNSYVGEKYVGPQAVLNNISVRLGKY